MCRAISAKVGLAQAWHSTWRNEPEAQATFEGTSVMVQIPKLSAAPLFRRSSPLYPRGFRNLSRIGLLAVALSASARCATVAHGTTQPIRVESDPPGAAVSLNCVQGSIPNLGTTPVTIDVQRKSKSCAVGISKEGYLPTNVPLQRTFSGVYVGNLLVGGVVGLVADAADGAMYKQGPSVVRVSLVELSRPPVVELSRQPVTTAPAPEPQTKSRMLQDRNGRDVAWMADEEADVAACTLVGKYDANEVTSEGRAAIADEVLKVGGDALFNPNGGALFDIYRCGFEHGVAQRSP
jgi:hypothetical protein